MTLLGVPLHGLVRHATARHGATGARHGTTGGAWHGMAPHSSARHRTALHGTTGYEHSTARHDMAWHRHGIGIAAYAYVKQCVQFTAPVLYLLITGLDASLALALRWVEAPAL